MKNAFFWKEKNDPKLIKFFPGVIKEPIQQVSIQKVKVHTNTVMGWNSKRISLSSHNKRNKSKLHVYIHFKSKVNNIFFQNEILQE